MDKNSFSYRFNVLLKEKPMTQKEIANNVGVRQSTISGWKNGTVAAPNIETGKKVAQLFGCALEWLMFGLGAQKAELDNHYVIPLGRYKYVFKEVHFVDDGTDEIRALVADGRKIKAVRVTTPSMSPDILENDILLIDEDVKEVDAPAIYAFFIDDRFYIASLSRSMSGKYIATTNMPKESITLETMPIVVGKVIRKISSL